ncbi:hypothetical protein PPGU19_059240 [Paraburkholderia sp. PGU19]|uniref:DAK2 domain-containing protein n=1 Tax=Paraburkholderia sp. PGU19 TaxID=2735434 RepID=UPI0015DC4722|nr:DAK2 domain-containing protein [Paraburkholderia sp. PGU19]BCG01356.1 hypothetical protein PPGU19_059240 [Paraburkholderia sp. PGU19]
MLKIGRAVAARIVRSKSKIGDKTVLDALVPSLDVLEASNGSAREILAEMIATARGQVEIMAALQSQKGRGCKRAASVTPIRVQRRICDFWKRFWRRSTKRPLVAKPV